MERVAYLLDSLPSDFIKCLALPRAVSNFESILQRQIDLRIEYKNLLKFLENFENDDQRLSHNKRVLITFPVPVEGFVTEDVMVEEYIDGIPISSYINDSSEAGISTCRLLAGPLLNAFLKMVCSFALDCTTERNHITNVLFAKQVFIDNFVHCDLHLGNVLVSSNSSNRDLKIVFLDAGTLLWKACYHLISTMVSYVLRLYFRFDRES